MNSTITILRKHIRKLIIPAAVTGLTLLALAGCKDFSFFNELGVKSGLIITPASVSILTGGTMSFNAYGGNGTYVFSIISGGGGTIDPATGVYTAPGTACTEVVMVTDDTNLSATASIDVVSSLDALEINPKVATLSPESSITFVATGGNPASYDYSFQTNNSGGSITSGGVYTAGSVIGVSDTIIVTDADSTVCAIPANVSVVAATSNVNYLVTADTFPAGADAGTALSGTFTVTNLGPGNGAKPVSWWLYLSGDGVFGGDGEILIASNSTAELPAGNGTDVTPTGTWPIVGGPYTLFIMVSAEDDMTHNDNIYDAGTITLTVPNVDYRVISISNTSLNHVGDSISGTLTLDNEGTDDGTVDVTWKMYVSANTAVDVGDTLVDSGTEPAMTAAEAALSISFGGTWPSSPGSYYLVAEVSAADDEAAGNDSDNTTASASAYSVHYPDVDYYADTISAAAGDAGKPLGCSFNVNNGGTDASGSTVTWNLYVSANTALDAGDYLADYGTAGPLAAGGFTAITPPSANWPTTPGNYYLIVEIESAEDAAAGKTANDVAVSATTYSVTVPDVDYYADTISAAAGDAGKPLGCSFNVNNGGTDASGSTVTWNLYVSANTALDAGDYLADYGTAGPLAAGGFTAITPPSANWPTTPGNYYLIVEIESAEDAAAGKTANDVAVSATTFNVAAPDVNYTVDQVNFVLAGSTYLPDGAVNGNFAYKNNGASDGSQSVSWEAYASLDTNLDAGDVLIESGSGLPPLAGSGGTSGSIPFSGSWPLDYGKYFLLVKVMSSEEVDPLDNAGSSASTESVGYFDETGTNDAGNDYEFLTDFTDLGLTFKPGMSIEITGEMTSADLDDIFAFNTGDCTMITFAVTYGPTSPSKAFLRIFLMDAPNHFIDGVSGTPDAISLNWLVDAPGAQRYLNLDNRGGAVSPPVDYYDGTYTCVITGH